MSPPSDPTANAPPKPQDSSLGASDQNTGPSAGQNAAAGRYLGWCASFFALLLLLVAGLSAIADPFDVHHFIVRPGFNSNKPGQHGHDRMVKAYAVVRQRPEVVLLGTSQVQFGLSPDDPALSAWAGRAYNLGLVNSTPLLAWRYFSHAQNFKKIQLAVIGLDLQMFDVRPRDTLQDFSEARMSTRALDGMAKWGGLWPTVPTLSDWPLTLASWEALRLSLHTLRHQSSIVSDLLSNGQRNPARLESFLAEHDSMAATFTAVARGIAKELVALKLDTSLAEGAPLAALKLLLESAAHHGTKVQLFWTPPHATIDALYSLSGHAEQIQELKRRLVALVAQYPNAALWDFGGINMVTTEEIPKPQGAQMPFVKMNNYWEPIHFTAQVGHRILSRMLEASPAEHSSASATATATASTPFSSRSFGVRLEPHSLEEIMSAQRQAQKVYMAGHPEQISQLQNFVAEAHSKASAAADPL